MNDVRPTLRGATSVLRKPLFARVLRSVMWRVVWRNEMLIWRAGPLLSMPSTLAGFTIVRVGPTMKSGSCVAETAMAAAGEEAGLVMPRLEHGDEFFGWMLRGQVVSFGWVTYRDRTVGTVKLADAERRGFLYNFYTMPEHRGRGLYPHLLMQMRRALTDEGRTELIIDVSRTNVASISGITKAGFEMSARTTYLTFFRRWKWVVAKEMVNDSTSNLFQYTQRNV